MGPRHTHGPGPGLHRRDGLLLAGCVEQRIDHAGVPEGAEGMSNRQIAPNVAADPFRVAHEVLSLFDCFGGQPYDPANPLDIPL